MSDLLPLVAVALNDQAAADAARELATAREERDMRGMVEVIRAINNGHDEHEDDETVVYASALFEDGRYASNTNLWEVKMKPSRSNICRLADLRDCHICVGGGFPVATLDDTLINNGTFDGWIDGAEGEACFISFCFGPHSTWLNFLIHGWPRDEWDGMEEEYDYTTQEFVPFLLGVADQYPGATVEFIKVTFAVSSIHGALRRLLPPKRKAEVRADRARRIAINEEYEEYALCRFVSKTMRERGNESRRASFVPQLDAIISFLSDMGINRLGMDDGLIVTAIETHERRGVEGLDELFDQIGPELDDDDENV